MNRTIVFKINDIVNTEYPCAADMGDDIRHVMGDALGKGFDSLQDEIMDSHDTLCRVKEMGRNEAFGNDPAIFYGLALAGECGELANNLVKAMRSGGSLTSKQEAIRSEIADVFIYTVLLAKTNDVDLEQAVRDKLKIIIERTDSGYYGGKLDR